jgi:glutathione S-transferase
MQQLGQIPSLTYGSTPLIESEVITEFLADTFPSHLLPAPTDPSATLFRSRVKIFTNLFYKFLVPPLFRVPQVPLDQVQLETVGDEIVAAVERHISLKLPEAEQEPFFAGRKEMTLAEVMVAGFVMRVHLYSKNRILPKNVNERLEANKKYERWSRKVRELEAVRETWPEEEEVLALAKILVANANTRPPQAMDY